MGQVAPMRHATNAELACHAHAWISKCWLGHQPSMETQMGVGEPNRYESLLIDVWGALAYPRQPSASLSHWLYNLTTNELQCLVTNGLFSSSPLVGHYATIHHTLQSGCRLIRQKGRRSFTVSVSALSCFFDLLPPHAIQSARQWLESHNEKDLATHVICSIQIKAFLRQFYLHWQTAVINQTQLMSHLANQRGLGRDVADYIRTFLSPYIPPLRDSAYVRHRGKVVPPPIRRKEFSRTPPFIF